MFKTLSKAYSVQSATLPIATEKYPSIILPLRAAMASFFMASSGSNLQDVR